MMGVRQRSLVPGPRMSDGVRGDNRRCGVTLPLSRVTCHEDTLTVTCHELTVVELQTRVFSWLKALSHFDANQHACPFASAIHCTSSDHGANACLA